MPVICCRPSAVAAARVATWDGASWSPLGTGINVSATTSVYSLAVHDDGLGGGPALFVAGRFFTAGGVLATHAARWDGSNWSALSTGLDDTVYTLLGFDDGNGPALFAGGTFMHAGGTPASRIARWDGASWSAVGTGTNGHVRALRAFDDGSGAGPALHASGLFTTAGGASANRVARWNGMSWSGLAGGLSGGSTPGVHALAVHDDGTSGGPSLFAVGTFTTADGSPARNVARWDGTTWSPVGPGVGGSCYAAAVYAGASGGPRQLYTAGSRVERWNGSSWTPTSGGLNGRIYDLEAYDDGSGSGPEIYAVGNFATAGVVAEKIAKWDGNSWSALASGLNGDALTLEVYDDGLGAGPALYAGGSFSTAGGVAADFIASWNGTSWSGVGGGTDTDVDALTTFDDGNGPALYAGGDFFQAGGVQARGVARWDGVSWSNLGSGLSFGVDALTGFDDGSGAGPRLYAGGAFMQSGGASVRYVAMWNGTSWVELGSGVNNRVNALAVFDDGSGAGPALYAGGYFSLAGGSSASRIAKWNGSSWSALGSGLTGFDSGVRAFAIIPGSAGRSPLLFAGGTFSSAGGTAVSNVAQWNGIGWSALGAGLNSIVWGLLAFDGGNGPALYAAGDFSTSPAGDSYVARWGCPDGSVGMPYCFGDGSGTPCPCGNAGASGEGCANSSGSGAVLEASGSTSVAADDLAFHAQQLLPNKPALLFVATNAVNSGNGTPFGDGLRCAGGSVKRFAVRTPDAFGQASWGPGLGAIGGWSAGDTRRFQVWYRDPTGSPCATNFNLSHGFEVAFGP